MKHLKFTDQQFLELYNQGYYDVEIASAFNVNGTSVGRRRWKLDLLPNSQISIHTVTNPKQHLKETTHQCHLRHYKAYKEPLKQFQRQYRLTHKEQIRQWGIKYRLPRKERQRERNIQHHRTHKEERKKYAQEHRKELAETQRRYYQRHKERINKRAKEKRRQNRNSFSLEKQTTIP